MMLSQKYRPRVFADVIGQHHQIDILRNSIVRGQIAPIYLVSGPWGTGKTSLSRIFASALNCPNFHKAQEPCNECDSCQAIIKDESFSYTELDAASSGNIDDIRKLKEDSHYSGLGGGKRVITLDECHQLSKPAQNALLKLFEEGSDNVVYLLCTTEADKLLDTIKSRSRRVTLRLPAEQAIYDRLTWVCEQEGIEYDPRALQRVVKAAKGHVRDALVFLDTLQVYGGVTDEAVSQVIQSDVVSDFYRILLNLRSDLALALNFVDRLYTRLSEAEIYDGLVQALLNAYKYMKGLEITDEVELSLIQQLSQEFSGDALYMAKFLLKKKNDRLTHSQLVCDLLLLEDVITQQLDLWAFINDGVVRKNILLAKKEGMTDEQGRELSAQDQRYQASHKKRGKGAPLDKSEKGSDEVELTEQKFISSLESPAFWERLLRM